MYLKKSISFIRYLSLLALLMATVGYASESPKILSKKDIVNLKKSITYEELVDKFGKPYGTTISVLTWPKQRKDVDYKTASEDVKWRNGYWFFFELKNSYIKSKSKLRFIASFKHKQTYHGEAIINLFQDMSVVWPEKDVDKLLGDITNIKLY